MNKSTANMKANIAISMIANSNPGRRLLGMTSWNFKSEEDDSDRYNGMTADAVIVEGRSWYK